jgi:hypothetical protein
LQVPRDDPAGCPAIGHSSLYPGQRAQARVKHACDIALTEGIALIDAEARDEAVARRFDRLKLERLTDSGNYLGSADAFIDLVLALASELTLDSFARNRRNDAIARRPASR